MFNKKDKQICPLIKQDGINKCFSEIIRNNCYRRYMNLEHFAKGINQPVELSSALFHGEHDWMGFVTFRELDLLFATTAGHWEKVYKNVVNNN